MSKLETNTIDNISGSSTLNIGDTNATNITIDNGVTTLDFGTGISTVSNMPAAFKNAPAFHARLSSDQTLAHATNTTVTCDQEAFDSDGCYNNTGSSTTLNGITVPAYSFAPNVAGKYFVYGFVRSNTSATAPLYYALITKNGSTNEFIELSEFHQFASHHCGGILEFNGTSDYITLLAYQNSGGSITLQGFSGKDEACNFGAYRIVGV